MDIQIGDRLRMKKPHPCGGSEWLVLRIGADLRLRCLRCGREFLGPRAKLERSIRAIERQGEGPT